MGSDPTQPTPSRLRKGPTGPMFRAVRILLLLFLIGCQSGAATPPTVEEARAFYASQPRHLRPVPHQETPAGLPDLRASTCGTCHQAIYAEWQASTHARAWMDDPQFQAELHKSETSGVAWMCINCHTPVENQLPKLVARLDGDLDKPVFVDNPDYDATLALEAITCATCHVRDGAVLGPWGDTTAPHPVRKSDDLLTPAVCTQCHQAAAHFPSIGLACAFETGDELAAGPYAAEGKNCQSCHMPEVRRPLMPGTPERTTRRHFFGGSLIPKQPAFADDVAAMRPFFKDGLAVRWLDPPLEGDTLRFELHNAEAGHRLPTGDPERFLKIDAALIGPDGPVAEHSERIGQVWEWSPQPRRIADNRLAPRERRTVTFPIPEGLPAASYVLHLRAENWRISESNMRYHELEGKTVPSRLLFESKTPIELP